MSKGSAPNSPRDGDQPRSLSHLLDLCQKHSNWGRWGPDDELGTLNFITNDMVTAAAQLVRTGRVFSLAVPLDDRGPQSGGSTRFNPLHLMVRDGSDAIAESSLPNFVDRHFSAADDIVTMPLQCGTQWDALSHIMHDNKIYNGYSASLVSSRGAQRNDIAKAGAKLVGRGVLLDIPRSKKKEWLDPGEVITADDLESCAQAERVSVGTGDILLVRTGRIAQARSEGAWNGFDNARAKQPGLGLETVPWIFDKEVAAVASDTLAVEVLPSQVQDVLIPLHIILIVYMGLTLGEIFDFESLADDCARDHSYEFMFVGPPLPFTGAVGSPLNPIVIK